MPGTNEYPGARVPGPKFLASMTYYSYLLRVLASHVILASTRVIGKRITPLLPKHQWEAGILEANYLLKKRYSPTGRKNPPTYETTHPPTTGHPMHPLPTLNPPTDQTTTAIHQCSSTYSSIPGTRGAVGWLVLEDLV